MKFIHIHCIDGIVAVPAYIGRPSDDLWFSPVSHTWRTEENMAYWLCIADSFVVR